MLSIEGQTFPACRVVFLAMLTCQQKPRRFATASLKDEYRHSAALVSSLLILRMKKGDAMTKKKTLQARPGAQGASKKTHSRSNKTGDPAKAASQTRQPYEQDPKRRIGQFSGTGEAPLMKK